MSTSNKKHFGWRTLRELLILCLPAGLFMAAFPQFRIGQTESMNLEVSLPEIWLVFFSVASLLNLPKIWQKYRARFLWTAVFPLYVSLSLAWSANFLRGFLTTGLVWLVWFAIWNLVLTFKQSGLTYQRKFIKVFLITSVIFAGVCWLQCLLDVLGVSRDVSQLCLGCISQSFGFPHPNGFTLEPQFMGNLLLAPALLSLALYQKSRLQAGVSSSKSYLALLFFFSATIFLTFSRGAIYAFAIAVCVQLATHIYCNRTNPNFKFGSSLLTILIIMASFIFTLFSQGVMAALGPTTDNFVAATTRALHHLSLGRIDLRPQSQSPNSEITSDSPLSQANSRPSQEASQPGDQTPIFSGYVAESTDVRVNLTNYALDVWNDSPSQIIFGTGIGSAGSSLYQKFPDELGSAREIVQNQYVSLLLELGVTGCFILLLALWPFLKHFSSLELAYLCTLGFFSGLPNAFQIYLLPPVLNKFVKHKASSVKN